MTNLRIVCTLVVLIAVVGCESYAEREYVSMAAVAPLLELKIGDNKTQTPPTAPGTLLGSYRGSAVGSSLDAADRRYAEQAAKKGLGTWPDKYTTRWSNPDTGHTGTFTPINSYLSDDRLRCRDYEQSITAIGQSQSDYGTACETDAGSWRVVETPVRRALRRRR
ncbi:MAG: RT0821/Lpp0805 family surface protein [Alphaproteobacteria bacterium]|nr:RT0821/Lpp0805 family surface protein [Alphaproteobacteria bacterium]